MCTPKEILQQLGKQIQDLRTSKNLSLEQLSQKSQVDAQLIVSIEEGRYDCDLLTLLHLATALDIKLVDLFLEE